MTDLLIVFFIISCILIVGCLGTAIICICMLNDEENEADE